MLTAMFDGNQTWFNIVQHGGETSATYWIQQCWTMFHQHVATILSYRPLRTFLSSLAIEQVPFKLDY